MVFESYERLNAERKCFIPLPNGDMIINGTLMDSDFVPKSIKEVAIRGVEGDFSSCRSFWNNKDVNPAVINNVVYAGLETYLNVDVSTEAPVFGFPTAQDPKTGEFFLAANLALSSVASTTLIGDEIQLRQQNITTPNVRVLDVNDDYWFIASSYNNVNYGSYCYKVNRKTLALESIFTFNVSSNYSYGYVPQVLYRDEDCFVYSNTGTIRKVVKSNQTTLDFKPAPGGATFPAPTNSGQYSCPFSPKVNGWHISVNPYKSQARDKNLSLQALKLNMEANQYELVQNIQMASVDARCDVSAAIQAEFTNLSTPAATYFHIWKIDDHTLGILKIPNCQAKAFASINNNQFPAYYIVSMEYDEDDMSVPPTFTLENAQYFDKTYTNSPILINPSKFALCYQNGIIAIFSYNKDAKSFVETSTFVCNGLSSACYFNGYLWWYDAVNQQIHFEIEGETFNIEESYDADVYRADANGQATGVYYISVRNGAGERVAKQIKLEPMTGIFTFDDGSIEKTFTTSEDKDVEVPIKIMSAPGRVIMKVTLV